MFEKNNLKISASCCADFQDWIVVVNDIKRCASPWMGHSPSPWFEFKDDNIILWSDEEEIENIYSIGFTQKEFEKQLVSAKRELNSFLKIIEFWTLQNYETDSSKLVKGMSHYLFVN